jgi:hypothetical protein
VAEKAKGSAVDGRTARVDWLVTFACAAYNLVRLRRLLPV